MIVRLVTDNYASHLCPEPWHAPRPETTLDHLMAPISKFLRVVGRADGRKRVTKGNMKMIKDFLKFMAEWIFSIVSSIVTMVLWLLALVMYVEYPTGSIILFLAGFVLMGFTEFIRRRKRRKKKS